MRRLSGFSVVLGVAFLLTGCPLTTDYPLGPSTNAPMDERLLGTWTVDKSSTDPELKSMAVFAFNKNEYYVEWVNKGDDEPSRLRAFITEIDNLYFVNVQDIEGDKKFIYCSFAVPSDNTLYVRVVDDALFKTEPSSSETLNHFIMKELRNTGLYREYIIFKRANKGP